LVNLGATLSQRSSFFYANILAVNKKFITFAKQLVKRNNNIMKAKDLKEGMEIMVTFRKIGGGTELRNVTFHSFVGKFSPDGRFWCMDNGKKVRKNVKQIHSMAVAKKDPVTEELDKLTNTDKVKTESKPKKAEVKEDKKKPVVEQGKPKGPSLRSRILDELLKDDDRTNKAIAELLECDQASVGDIKKVANLLCKGASVQDVKDQIKWASMKMIVEVSEHKLCQQ
jgi:hypothetical protein